MPKHTYPERKNIHLQSFDYSQNGAYFITSVTHKRIYRFGSVIGGTMVLNDAGKMLERVYHEMPEVIPDLKIDTYQIMPNHLHAIIIIDHVGSGLRARPGESLPVSGDICQSVSLFEIVGRFKSLTTRMYIEGVRENGWPRFEGRLWQRRFYEHVIRNEQDHQAIVDYIHSNPMNWGNDEER